MDSTKITCIAVDDEPAALRIIESFSNKAPQLKVVKTFRNPLEAITYINTNPVQLIFLDINMPELSGIDFLKSLSQIPLIILTTAYSEYALESYDYEVLDYLLKPIAFPRFLKAINKASKRLNTIKNICYTEPEKIILKDAGIIYNLNPNDIQYLESLGNYVKIYTQEQALTIKSGLQEFLDYYQIRHLLRIHKSFVVNVKKIKKMTYSSLNVDGKELPIGRKYKGDLRRHYGVI